MSSPLIYLNNDWHVLQSIHDAENEQAKSLTGLSVCNSVIAVVEFRNSLWNSTTMITKASKYVRFEFVCVHEDVKYILINVYVRASFI